jgi:hypothetical protein
VGSVEDVGHNGSRVLQSYCSAERVVQPTDLDMKNDHPVVSIKHHAEHLYNRACRSFGLEP